VSRRDLLRECNDKGAPLDEFQTGFCSRCVNPECSRSLYGQTRFDLRVNTWEDRLFSKVPQMDPSDPRFRTISGQKFLTLDTGRVPEIRGSWDDPRDLAPTETPLTPSFTPPVPPLSPPALSPSP